MAETEETSSSQSLLSNILSRLPTLKRSIIQNIQRSLGSIWLSTLRNNPYTTGEQPVLDPQPPQSPSSNELPQAPVQESLPPFLQYYTNDWDSKYGRGSAIIYNFQEFEKNSNRSGSEHDVANLDCLFKRMELTVSLKRFSKYKGHKKSSMIFVAILSHGNNNSIGNVQL